MGLMGMLGEMPSLSPTGIQMNPCEYYFLSVQESTLVLVGHGYKRVMSSIA